MAREVLRGVRPGIGEQNVVDECDGRRRSFDVEEQRPDREGCEVERYERRTEAHGLEGGVDPAVRVMRRPAGRILEESDRANSALAAQIEPVARSARDADQVPGPNLDRENASIRRMDVEEAPPFDDEADLVLV